MVTSLLLYSIVYVVFSSVCDSFLLISLPLILLIILVFPTPLSPKKTESTHPFKFYTIESYLFLLIVLFPPEQHELFELLLYTI